MKQLICIIIAIFFTLTSFGQEKTKGKTSIEVKGNCEMCKKRIEKAALSVKGVRSAEWSIENKKLDLFLNPKNADLNKVEEAVAKAGHSTENIEAEKENYEKLHSCCRYER